MTSVEFLMILRAINCPLFAIAVLLLVIRLADAWPSFSFGWRIAWHGIVLA